MKITKRRSIVAGVAGVSALGLTAALVPLFTADAATTAVTGIQIKVGSNGKCLNVSGGSTANNAKIIQYTCSANGTNDRFTLVPTGKDRFQIKNVKSGKCLNVTGNSVANNAKIIQYTCSTAYNSTFYVFNAAGRPTFMFAGVGSYEHPTEPTKCLNVPGNSSANSVQLVQYTCKDSYTNDKFLLPPTTSATPVRRPYTSAAPVAVRQNTTSSTSRAAVSISWIASDHSQWLVSDSDPAGVHNDGPTAEDWQVQWFGSDRTTGFTGRPYVTGRPDGRSQVIVHDAAAGDAVIGDDRPAEERIYFHDIGGALATDPTIGPLTSKTYAAYAVINGALWYAPQYGTSTQPPTGGWRSLGGSGLTGTPAVVATTTGARIFTRTTGNQLWTATLTGTTLSDWVSLGGSGLTGNPSAVAPAGGPATVFVNSGSGVVYKRANADGSFPADWTSTDTEVKTSGSPSVAWDDQAGRMVVAVRDTAGHVQVAYETGKGTGAVDGWLQAEGPAAAGDPTVFGYRDTTSGGIRGFGVAYLDADTEPYLIFQDTTTVKGGTSLAASKLKAKPLQLPTRKLTGTTASAAK